MKITEKILPDNYAIVYYVDPPKVHDDQTTGTGVICVVFGRNVEYGFIQPVYVRDEDTLVSTYVLDSPCQYRLDGVLQTQGPPKHYSRRCLVWLLPPTLAGFTRDQCLR